MKSITDEIAQVNAKIEHFKHMNAKADRCIMDLKCDVSEQQFERDLELEETVSEAARKR